MDISELYDIYLRHPVVTTDSRNCPQESIFFALKGASFNGNAFAAKALEQGCAYAVVDEEQYLQPGDGRYLYVPDVLDALQRLAHHHRMQLSLPVIQVTGTNGKTTTKELVSAVLSKRHRVLYTQGNLNNHIGVPLTLLRLRPEHTIAVIETGANHPGEIKALSEIVAPDYGIITNVGMAHLEGFGSFEGVKQTKGELYAYLRGRDGQVFVDADSPYLPSMAEGLRQIRYGRCGGQQLIVEGELVACAPYLHFRWRSDGPWQDVQSKLIGAYNITNMMAAATVGHTFGVPDEDISEALAAYCPSNNRSQLTVTAHNRLVVDAYNANPTSMRAALENFKAMQVEHKMVILGDMGELGAESERAHQEVVDFLRDAAFDNVWLVGHRFMAARHDFRTFADVEQVKTTLSEEMPQGYYILIKGSNSTKLYQLPAFL